MATLAVGTQEGPPLAVSLCSESVTHQRSSHSWQGRGLFQGGGRGGAGKGLAVTLTAGSQPPCKALRGGLFQLKSQHRDKWTARPLCAFPRGKGTNICRASHGCVSVVGCSCSHVTNVALPDC